VYIYLLIYISIIMLSCVKIYIQGMCKTARQCTLLTPIISYMRIYICIHVYMYVMCIALPIIIMLMYINK